MKKLTILFICILFLFFLLNNCSDSTNPTISDNVHSDLSKGKPSNPKIEELWIENYQEDKTIPDDEVIVHYRVTNAAKVDYLNLSFKHDDDADGEYSVIFDPDVFEQKIYHDGNSTFEGTFAWDGSVLPEFSSTGTLFDQLTNGTSADQYLLKFYVMGSKAYASNFPPALDERVKIIAGPAPGGPLWITNIELSRSPIVLSKRGGKVKYAAELYFKVTCEQQGFHGIGKLVADKDNQTIGGIANISFDARANSNTATRVDGIKVNKGKYYFVVKTLYSPDYSYDPSQNSTGIPVWDDTEYLDYLLGEPYAEITVN